MTVPEELGATTKRIDGEKGGKYFRIKGQEISTKPKKQTANSARRRRSEEKKIKGGRSDKERQRCPKIWSFNPAVVMRIKNQNNQSK